MKKIGLIGGIGPASTLDYYMGIINDCMQKANDGHYPEIIIYSIDMAEMMAHIEKGNWDKVVTQLVNTVEKLCAAGADFAAIASNTPHFVFDELKKRVPVPLISIVDKTCELVKANRFSRPLAIGTLFTMKNGLYANALKKYGVVALSPSDNEQKEIYSLFYPNLENGIVIEKDKEKMLNLVGGIIKEQNADSLILGCTELPMMIKPEDVSVPVIDTTQIHIKSIVEYATA